MCEAMKPAFQTERFDVFCARCVRNPAFGVHRDVYLAFHRHRDIPRPVCVCTIWPNCPIDGLPYLEWLEVTCNEQRTGIASEVFLGVQDHIGPMIADPVTHAGEKLVEALGDRIVSPEVRKMMNDPTAETEQRSRPVTEGRAATSQRAVAASLVKHGSRRIAAPAQTSGGHLAAKGLAMELPVAAQLMFETTRFNVVRDERACHNTMGMKSDVYKAFYRAADATHPVCTVVVSRTVFMDRRPYLQWIRVARNERRKGIATEVLLGLQAFIGPMVVNPATHAGEKLVEALGDKLLGKAPFPFNEKHVQKLLDDGYSQGEIDEAAKEVRASLNRIFTGVDGTDRKDRSPSINSSINDRRSQCGPAATNKTTSAVKRSSTYEASSRNAQRHTFKGRLCQFIDEPPSSSRRN
jgi:hypothetical protein